MWKSGGGFDRMAPCVTEGRGAKLPCLRRESFSGGRDATATGFCSSLVGLALGGNFLGARSLRAGWRPLPSRYSRALFLGQKPCTMCEKSWNLGYGAYAVQSYYVTPNLGKWSHRCRGSRMTHAVVLQALTTSKAPTVVARVAGGISTALR